MLYIKKTIYKKNQIKKLYNSQLHKQLLFLYNFNEL